MNTGIEHIIPELILAAGALAIVVVRALHKGEVRLIATILAALSGVAALAVLSFGVDPFATNTAFYGAITLDPFAWFLRALYIALFLIVVLFSYYSRELSSYVYAEYMMLVMVVTVAMSFLSAAADLIVLYLAMETISLSSYLLTGFIARKRASSEAALKYVLFGSVSSAVMVFGISFLYGVTGSTGINDLLTRYALEHTDSIFLLYAFALILIGAGFKIALVPLHFWSPDVYQAAPTPVTAFFSVGPKAAGFALLYRLFVEPFDIESLIFAPAAVIGLQVMGELQFILTILAILTMTAGNLLALRQENLKRLLAYSSVSHAGFMLIGILTFSSLGIQALLFSLFVYLLMNLGAFFIVMFVNDHYRSEDIGALRGLAWRGGQASLLAIFFAIFLFSLAGLPPFAGFIGKWYLFAAAVERGMIPFLIIALINAVISLYYYARIVREMFLKADGIENDSRPPLRVASPALAVLGVLAFGSIYYGLFFGDFMRYLQQILP